MAEPTLEDAVGLHQAGRLSEAANLYQQIVRANPANFEALYALSIICVQTGRLDEAQQLLGEALAVNPRFTDGWCGRGVLLMHLGRREEALASLDQALALKPDFFEALQSRAAVLAELNRAEDALVALDQVLALRPDHQVSWNNRGTILIAMQRLEEALTSFDRSLAINPDFLDALSNRATILLELKRLDEALLGFDRALAVHPGYAIGWNNRGNTLMRMKRFEDALSSYDRALAIKPDLTEAADNRENALLELKRCTRCPPAYMRNLFDDFSSHYDDTMLVKLGYRGHVHVRTLAEKLLPRLSPPWRILDLGCGTGLVGEAFKDLAVGGALDGIDIAPRMIEAARARGIYGQLILGDLETILAQPGPSYDLIVSADTMIYLGDLFPTFSGVAKRLVTGGFYIFACESKEGDGWEQTPAKRFRHSEAYLREEAARHGLAFAAHMQCVLRREANEPAPGFAVALQKPASH